MFDVNSAKDLVDEYGADADLWPADKRGRIEDLIDSDSDFADYVRQMKRIEDMLANWDEQEDGADVSDPDSSTGTGRGAARSKTPLPEEKDEDEEDDDAPDILEGALDRLGDVGDMDDMFSDFIIQKMGENSGSNFTVFSRDYDTMTDIAAPDGTAVEPIDTAVAKSTGPLQKDLRRLIAARSQVKRLPGRRSGRLHGPNLHRILGGDDRVFYKREQAPELDTAISLVIDCSGSMNGPRLRLATESAYAIASVLHRLNVAFECIGFTDGYHHPEMQSKAFQEDLARANQVCPPDRVTALNMPKFKTFDERWTLPVQRRFASIYNAQGHGGSAGIAMSMTPEGCGVEFAARRLLTRQEKRKIMIVMTDGSPGGTRHSYTGGTCYAHAANMVQAVEAAGVDLVGVGIKHNGPSAYYPNSIVIEQIEEMPKQLMGVLRKFIGK